MRLAGLGDFDLGLGLEMREGAYRLPVAVAHGGGEEVMERRRSVWWGFDSIRIGLGKIMEGS